MMLRQERHNSCGCSLWPLFVLSSTCLFLLPSNALADEAAPHLDGAHFRITALEEKGFLDASGSVDDGTLKFSGYLVDVLEAIAKRANFTYDLLPPSGFGSLCTPQLTPEPASNPGSTNSSNIFDTNQNSDLHSPNFNIPSAYAPQYRTQYTCGETDVNDLPLTERSTDMYLGMYYVTPSRQLRNHFTVPFNPPFSGTLAMFGTATRIPSFQALVQLQQQQLAPPACAPDGTALIRVVEESFPGIQIKGLFGGEEEIYQSFLDGTCEIFILDGPLASSFVLRRSQRGECMAKDKPIGTIGEPMSFGLSHYAIGIRKDIPTEVVNTLSYWMSVLMSCNPLDPDGPCPEGNLASFYQGRGGTGAECGYVLFPEDNSLKSGEISAIVIGSVVFVAFLLIVWHRYKIRRQARKFAKKAKIVREQASRERELNEFLAHEVRNPLASAIAALSFVSSKAGDPAVVASSQHRSDIMADIGVVESSLQFVSELLRNMLDLSRGKQVKLERVPTDILKDAFEPVGSILFMRGAKVDVQIVCPKNLMVLSDRMRLKQIILNLAGNSTKFVQEGFIRLRAEVKDGQVYLHVEDSGPGIPAEKRHRLFAKFQESLDVLNQGTGIGLALCRNLSEMLGADLYLDDTFQSGLPNSPGTRFTMRLNQPPLQIENDVGAAAADGMDAAMPMNGGSDLPEHLSVLFVDDDTIIRKMFSRSLRRVAPTWKVREASNGETALQMVEEEKFDLIFIDQYMASIEKQLLGTEAVRLLRTKGVTSIICGLSANDKEEEFLDAGATGFMLKPFPAKKDDLKREIQMLLRSSVELPEQNLNNV